VVTKQGKILDVLLNVDTIYDRTGKPLHSISTQVDITEHKQEEERIKQLAHDLRERIKELDCVYRISEISIKEGISIEAILKEIVQFIPPGWQYPGITGCSITYEGKKFKTKNFKVTKWMQRKDIIINNKKLGLLDVCYLEEKPEIDEGPFLKAERKLINAITEQLGHVIRLKRVDEALQESEELYKTIEETLPDAVIITDLEGNITYASNQTAMLHGYNNIEELHGKNAFELIASQDHKKASIDLQKTLNGKIVRNVEYTFLRKNGTQFPAELSSALINDDFGEPKGFIAITKDITKRKKVEIRLAESELELEKHKLALVQKNMALRELIEQIEMERRRIEDNIEDNIEMNIDALISPILEKLKVKNDNDKYIDLVQHILKSLASPFGTKITKKRLNLTPREIEICSMVKKGFANKEISHLLNISSQTVVKHRQHIRHKLGISNKSINLISFLREI